jgi:uncharacterized protein (TIGR00369 family)
MPQSPAPLEELNRLIRENRIDDYPSPNRALGMKPTRFGPGASEWIWENQPDGAINPFGTIQGGYLAVFVDELLSTAIGSLLEPGEWAVTAETKVSYLRATRPGTLKGSARVIRRSRSLAFLHAEVADSEGALLVVGSSTWSIARA